MSDQSAPPEIVIVRRRSNDDEGGHHGGVWKIAYADFMTAMMAFFLVMWLVNASDKKVLTQVASYFNPLKMSDRVTSSKGVEDMAEGGQKRGKGKAKDSVGESDDASKEPKKDEAHKEEAEKEKVEKEAAKDGSAEPPKEHEAKPSKKAPGGLTDLSEQELFNDPYGILEKLAASAQGGKNGEADSDAGLAKEHGGGTAFRDPFDPDFNRVSKGDGPQELGAGKGQTPEASEAKTKNDENNHQQVTADGTGDVKKATTETKSAKMSNHAAQALQSKLEKELADLNPGQRPSITTTVTPEGILISLTDEFDFEMFKVSSPLPNPHMVAAMKKIGGVLRDTEGAIVVRGHTDARKFKQGTSDNWLLSSQRALMSRYMLIGGGVAEKRIEKIEGYADTMPKVPGNGFAAQNRRIEVLVRKTDGQ